MRRKLQNKKGFTLAELLIVVAIIAVLVAIMIPVFGSSRANAIQAKDAANVRAAYAEAVAEAMAGGSYTASGSAMTLNVSITVKVDTATTIDYGSVDATGNTYTATGGKIKISTTGASAAIEEIPVDDDVTLSITKG